MADLQQTRYDKLIRRVANIVGAGAIVTETLQEVFPVFDLENTPAELMVLGGWRLAMRGTNITPPAAQKTASQLFNPVDSGMVMVLSTVVISVSAAENIFTRLDNAPLLNSNGFGQFRDKRAGDPISDAAVGNTRIETPKIVTPIVTYGVLTSRPLILNDSNGLAVLMPGTGFTVGHQVDAVTLTVAYFWRERVLEASEFVV